MIRQNESFQGREVDFTKMQQYNKLLKAARWMERYSFEVVGLTVEPIAKDRPNAIVSLDVRRLASFTDDELEVFRALFEYADSVFLSGVKEHIRFTFGVRDIWTQ